MNKLDPIADPSLLDPIEAWQFDATRSAISRSFKFADFAQAFSFMTQIAIAAEKRDHHPEWFNVYNRVDIVLTTHDIKGLSKRDIDLAAYIDEAFAKFTTP